MNKYKDNKAEINYIQGNLYRKKYMITCNKQPIL